MIKSYKLFTASRFFLVVILMGTTLLAAGQSYIDEDYLEDLEKNAQFMLNDEANPAFKTNAIPSSWDKESAAIIGYSRSVSFDRKSSGGFFTRKERSLWFIEKDRFKIRLHDKNSVEAFSEIYFRSGSKDDGFIARIIKPDGRITNVDLKNAVGVENTNDVPEYFQSFFDKLANSQYHYYKAPVPDLEPGDILEYVTNTRSRLDVTSSGYIEFAPIYEVCSKKYPIQFNEIIIETDDKSFFKYLSLNGAPQFAKENSSEKGFFRYVFTDRSRETQKDINFVSPLLQYPLVKFQVIYSNNDEVKGALIGEKGELKSGFNREELSKKAWEDYEQVGSSYYPGSYPYRVQDMINQSWSELKKLGAKDWTEKQYIDNVYYMVRNKVVMQDNYLPDKYFAYIFGSLLYQRDIKSELIITIGNNIGTMKEILFDQEIRYAIKIGDKLYFNVTDYSNPGELVEALLDNESYIIYEPAKKGGKQEIKPFTLPGTKAEENTADVNIRTELTADMKSLLVIRNSSYKGIHKARNISDVLKYTPYMFDDYRNYGGNSPTDNMKSNQVEEYNNSVRAIKEEFKKQKPEYVKASLESEFHQSVKDVHFDLVTDGRTQKKNVLAVKEGFELTNYVRQAGKKYLISLPGLVGSQLQIKKEERDRKIDIDVRYPRSLTWTISLKIPDGYTVEGLSELNKSVSNDAGAFTVSAKEENGSVVLNIAKIYKQKNIPRDRWQDMLAFIDAAYNNSFKYILLKPKQ